ncbi:MAG: carbohydrate-binding domain-containing protein [Lachnospiraceae bacterium]|nr:carbohydrate-binding domain-containing protein [Lachnospiraceae bacterium]
MSADRKIDRICIIILILSVVFTVFFIFGERFGIEVIADEDSESYEGTEYFTSNDQVQTVASDGYSCLIELSGSSGSIRGNGAYFNDGNLYITGGGKYFISGTLTGGSIIVDAYDSSKVWLVLGGVSVTCEDDAALRVENADKVFINLAEGSENTLSSGETYNETALNDNTGGTLFSHDDLTISGTGSLKIKAAYKHGIDANDSLHITGGDIEIDAAADGIHVNDEFNFDGASLIINAGDDAIHSDSTINVLGGLIEADECYEGLEALIINVEDGDIVIYSSDDGFNANGGSSDNMGFGAGGGNPGQFGGKIRGGNFGNTDGSVSGNGGFGDGPGAAGDGSDFGMAGSSATDDGGFRGESAESDDESDEESYISISGGNITVINSSARDADGIDSNGSIYISGGVIRVSLPSSGSNCAIDYASENGGELVVTGGEIIACGSFSMAEGFSESSTQCGILYNAESTYEADTLINIVDTDGNVIMSFEAPEDFNSLYLSSPEFEVGNTYVINLGDDSEEIAFDSVTMTSGSAGMGGMGGMRGGMGSLSDNGMRGMGTLSGNGGMRGMGGRNALSGNVPGNGHGDMGGNGFGNGHGDMSGNGFFGGRESLSSNGFGQNFKQDFGQTDGESGAFTGFSGISITELESGAYLLLLASVLTLVFGIVFAASFKRR